MVTVTNDQIIKAKAAGLINVEALAAACIKHNLPFYLGCTILEKETGGDNIYGHDRGGVYTIVGDKPVTEANFKEFIRLIGLPGAISNGVGPMQITYKGHFPIMAQMGLRAWVPAENIDYGIGLIARDYHNQIRAGKASEAAFQYAACVYNLGKWDSTWPYGLDAVAKSKRWAVTVASTPVVIQPPVVVPPVVVTPPVIPQPTEEETDMALTPAERKLLIEDIAKAVDGRVLTSTERASLVKEIGAEVANQVMNRDGLIPNKNFTNNKTNPFVTLSTVLNTIGASLSSINTKLDVLIKRK